MSMNSFVRYIGLTMIIFCCLVDLQAIHPIQHNNIQEVLIPKGTAVKLYLAQDLNSAKSTAIKGNTVRMEIAEDVIIAGKCRVIRTGSRVFRVKG